MKIIKKSTKIRSMVRDKKAVKGKSNLMVSISEVVTWFNFTPTNTPGGNGEHEK